MKLDKFLPTRLQTNVLYRLALDGWRYKRANFLGLLLASLTVSWLLGGEILNQYAALKVGPTLHSVTPGPTYTPYQLSLLSGPMPTTTPTANNPETALVAPSSLAAPVLAESPALVSQTAHARKTYPSLPVDFPAPADAAPTPAPSAIETASAKTPMPQPARVYVIQPKITVAAPRAAFSYGPTYRTANPVLTPEPVPTTTNKELASGELRARRVAKANAAQVSAMNH